MTDSTNIDDLPTTNQPNITLETSEVPVQNNIQPGLNATDPSFQLSNKDINKIVEGIQLASNSNMTKLPSRDIPTNQNNITNDPQIQPNYIPQKKNKDYVEQFDKQQALQYKQQQQQKKDLKRLDTFYDEMQTPILISIVFFICQLPFVNKKLFYLFPSLFIKECVPSLGGYLMKTFLFTTLYFTLTKTIGHLSAI